MYLIYAILCIQDKERELVEMFERDLNRLYELTELEEEHKLTKEEETEYIGLYEKLKYYGVEIDFGVNI